MKKSILLLLLLAFIAASCNLPTASSSGGPASSDFSQLLVTPNPNATPTPTPFMPAGIAHTGDEDKSTPSPGATPTIQPTIDTYEDMVKIMLFGSDWRPESGYRTDVIMLLAINKDTGAASVVSFPRDLYVTLPGYRNERLNVAQPLGGFDLTQKTFQYNFGFTPDYYMTTNFQGFVSIIDTLGGVDVYAAYNLYDDCHLPIADSEGKCSLGPGLIHMDGETALWYVRSRYSTSDFDRTRRAQEVMKAIFERLMSLNAIARAPDLYSTFRNSVETNISLDVVISLIGFAPDLLSNPDKVHQYAIGPDDVWAWKTPEGAQVLLPNPEKIQPLLTEALNVK